MKITIIHGQSHRGSSYHITRQIVDKISDEEKEINEFFMPDDGPNFCMGCYQCIMKSEYACLQSEKVQNIVAVMETSDLILISSPTYCLEMTGQLKTFFDHLAYMWLSHRPKSVMFQKVGIAISTAAGGGSRKVTKSIAKQLFWMGVPKVYRFHKNVKSSTWQMVSNKIKESIDKGTTKLSRKVEANIGKVRPGLGQRFLFTIMRSMQKSNNWNEVDKNYWKENGWLGKKKPW
ncbi:MAG: NAD(P)H-dependent oxidoreductase [Candidatus Atribacteria bacterium]|nr:NAD(P)H-dependent oxidoreductase [Candidatus Atribacteria bacterium]